MPVNLWSGTDYLKKVTTEHVDDNNFACYPSILRITSSNLWQTNGDYCIECQLNNGEYAEYHYYNFDKTKNYMFKADVYFEKRAQLRFAIVDWDDRANDISKSVTAPAGTSTNLSISIHSNEIGNHTELRCTIKSLSDNNIMYTDNWELLKI